MERSLPSFEDFSPDIEGLFGKTMASPALEASHDFWINWNSFADLISRRQLSVHVDQLFLAHNYPQYRRYHTLKGAGLLLSVIGFVSVWFLWYAGLPLLTVGVALYYIGNCIRYNDAK